MKVFALNIVHLGQERPDDEDLLGTIPILFSDKDDAKTYAQEHAWEYSEMDDFELDWEEGDFVQDDGIAYKIIEVDVN